MEKKNLLSAYQMLEKVKLHSDQCVEDFVGKFQCAVEHLTNCGVQLPSSYLGLRLLTAANMSVSLEILAGRLDTFTFNECKQLVFNSNRVLSECTSLPKKPTSHTGTLYQSTSTENNLGRTKITLHGVNPRPQTRALPHVKESASNNSLKKIGKISHSLKPKPEPSIPVKEKLAIQINNFRQGKNPCNKNGIHSKCVYCRSIYHFVADCPDNCIQKVDFPLKDLKSVLPETYNTAVVSASVSKSVVGMDWLLKYIAILPETEASKFKYSIPEASCVFAFSDVVEVPSVQIVSIPVTFGNRSCSILAEVIDEPIPLLLSRATISRMEMIIYPTTDVITVFNQTMMSGITSSGLYTLSLRQTDKQCLHASDDASGSTATTSITEGLLQSDSTNSIGSTHQSTNVSKHCWTQTDKPSGPDNYDMQSSLTSDDNNNHSVTQHSAVSTDHIPDNQLRHYPVSPPPGVDQTQLQHSYSAVASSVGNTVPSQSDVVSKGYSAYNKSVTVCSQQRLQSVTCNPVPTAKLCGGFMVADNLLKVPHQLPLPEYNSCKHRHYSLPHTPVVMQTQSYYFVQGGYYISPIHSLSGALPCVTPNLMKDSIMPVYIMSY